MANLQDFYLNANSLSEATSVFSDAEMTQLASSQAYSDGSVIRPQSVAFTPNLSPDVSDTCPMCETSCEDDVIFAMPQGVYSTVSLQGSITFPILGAVKITVRGVSSKPFGVDIEQGTGTYNYFSSTLAQTGIAGRIWTAQGSSNKSYFWSTGGVGNCSAWTNSSNNFSIYHYSPQLGDWEDTGSVLENQSTTNRLSSGLGTGANTPGDLITYVPITSLSQTIDIVFEFPCAAANGYPVLSVGCPRVLSSKVCSTAQSSHSSACSETTLNYTLYKGAVSTSPSGAIGLRDFMYTNASATGFATDGYYKTTGANLEGVSASFGSFRLQDGVVTEIQSC